MNNSWNDELISAYVDGELTAEEQAQVEQALASDARLRQMHDDLRALRHSLQAMPRVKLDAGFAARVLEAAQKAKVAQNSPAPAAAPLLEQTAAAATAAAKHADHHHLAVVPAHPTEPTSWHVMVWSLFGAAAALLLVLLWPGPMSQVAERLTTPGETQIAQVDAAKDAAKQQLDVKEKVAAPIVRDRASEGERGEFKELRQSGVEGAGPEFDLRRKETAADDFRSGDSVDRPEKARLKKALAIPGNVRSDPSAGGAPPPDEGAKRDLGEGQRRLALPSGKGGTQSTGNAQRDAARAMEQKADEADAVNRGTALDSDRLVVVRLSVPADVLKRRGIDGTLAKNGITVAAAEFSDTELAAKKRELPRPTEKEGGEAAGNLSPELAADAQAALKGVLEREERAIEGLANDELDRVTSGASTGDVDVLYMEASQQQLDKMLEDLQTQPGFSVELSDANTERSKHLGDNAVGRSGVANDAGGFGGGALGGRGGGLGAAGFGNAKSAPAPAGAPDAAALAPPAPPAPVVAGPASAAPAPPSPGIAGGRGFAPQGAGTAEKLSESAQAGATKPSGRGGGAAPTPVRGLAGDESTDQDKPVTTAERNSIARPQAMVDELQTKDTGPKLVSDGYARRVPLEVFRRQAEEYRRSQNELTKQAANGAAPALPAPASAMRASALPKSEATPLVAEKSADAGKKLADRKQAEEVSAPRVRVLFVIEAKE